MSGILIVSGVRLYSEVLSEFLAHQPGLHVVGVADTAAGALRVVETVWPTLILLDQSLPGSLETLGGLRRLRPSCPVIALGMDEHEEALLRWAEAGAAGFVAPEASLADLLATIESTLRGELVCSPRLAASLLRRLASHASAAAQSRRPLTMRETEILHLIDEGLSNKEIAARLGIELATVKNHVHNLLEKLRVHRRADAAMRLRGRHSRRATPQCLRRIQD